MRHNGVLIPDEEGDELPDLEAAHALALNALREMARLPHVYGPPRTWRKKEFVITDETGTILLTIPFATLL